VSAAAQEGYRSGECVDGLNGHPVGTPLIDALADLLLADDPEPGERWFDWGGGDRQENPTWSAWQNREFIRQRARDARKAAERG